MAGTWAGESVDLGHHFFPPTALCRRKENIDTNRRVELALNKTECPSSKARRRFQSYCLPVVLTQDTCVTRSHQLSKQRRDTPTTKSPVTFSSESVIFCLQWPIDLILFILNFSSPFFVSFMRYNCASTPIVNQLVALRYTFMLWTMLGNDL